MKKTAASGSGKVEKGDALDPFFVCEGKSTRTGLISVTPKMLDKLWSDGKKMGKIPFLDLDTVEQGEIGRPRYFVLIPAPVWQILKRKLTGKEFELLKPR